MYKKLFDGVSRGIIGFMKREHDSKGDYPQKQFYNNKPFSPSWRIYRLSNGKER
jgi:hypothetical protein